MFAPPPKMNKVSIYSMNCEKLIEFYSYLGMLFNTEIKEGNRTHYTYIFDYLTFELREVNNEDDITKNITLRFLMDEIDGYIEGLKEIGIKIVKDSWTTETHQHIYLNDPDGNLIELMTEKKST